MSSVGYLEAKLMREQRERARLETVKARVRAMLNTCQATLASIHDPAEQQLAARDLAGIQKELARIAGDTDARPDAALKAVKACQSRLHTAIGTARRAAQQWSAERAKAEALLAEGQAKLQAAAQDASPAGLTIVTQLADRIEQARQLCRQGRYAETVKALAGLETQVEKAHQASFDETVRRKVVGGLLSTLQAMGFVADGPNLEGDVADGGRVSLVGRLPSGKTARFEVALDGRLAFDFDGYEGRACGKDLAAMETALRENFGVQFGPPQVTWKNPDKIAQGAAQLPTGHRQGGGR